MDFIDAALDPHHHDPVPPPPPEPVLLRRAAYIQREYELVVAAQARGELADAVVYPVLDDGPHGAYRVVVSVTPEGSPWRGGRFGFGVHLPADYPYVVPRITAEQPLRHPAVTAGEVTDFGPVFDANDPVRSAVLGRVVRHLLALFAPLPSHGPEVRSAAAADVERRSLLLPRAQASSPFAVLLTDSCSEWLLQRYPGETKAGAKDTAPKDTWASWFVPHFAGVAVPRALRLQDLESS